jgi:uncharacterized RDD family membrane protein YckC
MTDQQISRSEALENFSPTGNDIWRKEIHARVAGYKTRRGRRVEGAYSMRFPFPPPESELSSTATIVPEEEASQDEFLDANLASVALTGTSLALVALPAMTAVVSFEVGDVATELPPAEPGGLSTETAAAPVDLADAPELPTLPEQGLDPKPPELPELMLDPEPPPAAAPRPRPQRKVIAFPRQTAVPLEIHRLADPVLPEQPRILDVPEELEALPTTPFLDGLQFGPGTQPVTATHADTVELPFRAAGRAHRMYAALLDGALVGAGTALLAAVGHQMLPKLVFTKPVLLTAAALPVLLWASYQYLLLVYGGATAGMRVAKIRLRTFKGKSPCLRERRHRVLALYFSMASFVMGLLWAFVDVDTLCWHDRISRTYLTRQE